MKTRSHNFNLLIQGEDVVDLLKQAVKRRGLNIEVEKSGKVKNSFARVPGGGDPERHNRLPDVNGLEGAQV